MFDIASAQTASGGGLWSGILLIVSIFLLFWLLIIRPQSKRMKQHQNLVNSLKKGDRVLTHAGIIGRITKISDGFFTVEIAAGTEVQFDKNYIAGRYEPAPAKNIPAKK